MLYFRNLDSAAQVAIMGAVTGFWFAICVALITLSVWAGSNDGQP
jgi:hypothetical protein